MAGEVQQYDAALATYRSSLGCLAGVPGALQGKENSLADDSRALAAAGLALQESCAELEGLRALRNSGGASGAGAPRDGEHVPGELLHSYAHCRTCSLLVAAAAAATVQQLCKQYGHSTTAVPLPVLSIPSTSLQSWPQRRRS